ncbi:hypothetical protein BDZ91DRAFT_724897 [Kalaharituber pfeilii]|nr:hypothetical protein BDZ91DRAFT_724897 [Kalaharituber pfeilii]
MCFVVFIRWELLMISHCAVVYLLLLFLLFIVHYFLIEGFLFLYVLVRAFAFVLFVLFLYLKLAIPLVIDR